MYAGLAFLVANVAFHLANWPYVTLRCWSEAVIAGFFYLGARLYRRIAHPWVFHLVCLAVLGLLGRTIWFFWVAMFA